MNKTTVKAEFSICGDVFDPSEITKVLGIEPMEVNLKGSMCGTRKRPSTETCWSVFTEKEESYDVDEQTRKILFLLSNKVDALNDIKKKHNTTFILSLLIEIRGGERPAI